LKNLGKFSRKRVSLKICGITNLEDAELCSCLGADALGFIFTEKSPRFLSFQKYQSFAGLISPFCQKVGVFQDLELRKLIDFLNSLEPKTKPDFVQLHGNENSDYIQELHRKAQIKIIKSYRLENSQSNLEIFQQIEALDLNLISALMIDSKKEKLGVAEISDFLGFLQLTKKKIKKEIAWALAGKLDDQSLEIRIKQHQPDLIDLCSSLEKTPGKKDPIKLKRFFESWQASFK